MIRVFCSYEELSNAAAQIADPEIESAASQTEGRK